LHPSILEDENWGFNYISSPGYKLAQCLHSSREKFESDVI
jgi:hypothetical protein